MQNPTNLGFMKLEEVLNPNTTQTEKPPETLVIKTQVLGHAHTETIEGTLPGITETAGIDRQTGVQAEREVEERVH